MVPDTIPTTSWGDRPLFIVGGGPSLIGRNLSVLRHRGRVLGVNRAADLVPCHATYTQDQVFFDKSRGVLESWAKTQEVYAAIAEGQEVRKIPGVVHLVCSSKIDFSFELPVVADGLNSGYGALNLAVLRGAKLIYLLGYDLTKMGPEDPSHWHGGYEWTNRRSLIYYQRWADRFQKIADVLPSGIQVWNVNRYSAIRCFPFTSYESIGVS